MCFIAACSLAFAKSLTSVGVMDVTEKLDDLKFDRLVQIVISCRVA